MRYGPVVITGWSVLTMTVKVKYLPSALNDHPRSASPATRITIPAAKAAAPGRISAAGTMRGAR